MLWRAVRGIAFTVDAERVHRASMAGLRAWSAVCPVTPHAASPRRVLGLDFPNPLGLAAGFDKDAEAVPAWQSLGFGFVEVGTVTALPQPGNEKPRLFRLADDEAILNRMGFNNHGAQALAARLADLRRRGRVRVPVLVNIGKSKVVANDAAVADYLSSFRAVADVADAVVVNISSPNTPGLRALQTGDEVARLVSALIDEDAKRARRLPLLVKLAPDLSVDDMFACGEAARGAGAAGLVLTNTTLSRDGLRSPVPEGTGGVSGRPLTARAQAVLVAAKRHFGDTMALVGVGGIHDVESARARLDAGADLIQAYTGFVYGGPAFARRVVDGVQARRLTT